MALPEGAANFAWPPKEYQTAYLRYSEHSAWYDGSPLALAAFYGGYGGSQLGGQSLGFFNTTMSFPDPSNQAAPFFRRFMFWAKTPAQPVTRVRLHVPIAADMATTSADLLFSEEPEFPIPEAHVMKAEATAMTIQERLDTIAAEGGVFTGLLESAEVAAALGGVYLKAGWDTDLSDDPLLTAVHADCAVPEFQWGRLTAVTFWKIVYSDKSIFVRALERHEKGRVLHGLYKGDAKDLGSPMPLSEMPETAMYADKVDEDGAIEFPGRLSDRLLAVYIPNMRPNRAERGSPLGRSDYAGTEGLMDALDETYTSWMRDIRIGRGRLVVDKEYIRSEGKGKGADFDSDREVWQTIDVGPKDKPGITVSQFNIRTQEHLQTALSLTERIVASAGYSASTFGLRGEGTIKTATEIAAREQLSLVTRGKKAQYWGPQLREILETMLMIDAEVFNGPGSLRPEIKFADSVRDDIKEIAATAQILRAAKAASTDTLVRMLHSDWGDDQVATEVKKIMEEGTSMTPTVNTLPPGPGGAAPVPGLPSATPPPAALPAPAPGGA